MGWSSRGGSAPCPAIAARTPVVLVTADLVALRAAESGQAGVDVCVRKPFTKLELLAAVATAARLTPVADAFGSDDLGLDTAGLCQFRRSLRDPAFAPRLDAAADRIADLITLLERPDAQNDATVREAVHDLVGVAGLLGLTALSANLRWFDTAEDRAAPAAALHAAAAAALRALRREREPAAASR